MITSYGITGTVRQQWELRTRLTGKKKHNAFCRDVMLLLKEPEFAVFSLFVWSLLISRE